MSVEDIADARADDVLMSTIAATRSTYFLATSANARTTTAPRAHAAPASAPAPTAAAPVPPQSAFESVGGLAAGLASVASTALFVLGGIGTAATIGFGVGAGVLLATGGIGAGIVLVVLAVLALVGAIVSFIYGAKLRSGIDDRQASAAAASALAENTAEDEARRARVELASADRQPSTSPLRALSLPNA